MRMTLRPGEEARPVAADEATGWSRGSSPPRVGKGRADGCERCRRGHCHGGWREEAGDAATEGHGTAAGVFTVGDDFADEAVRGSGRGGYSFGQGHRTAKRDVASVNKAAWTSAGYVVAVRRGEGERDPPLRM